jgi:pyocin large subunit-like protein
MPAPSASSERRSGRDFNQIRFYAPHTITDGVQSFDAAPPDFSTPHITPAPTTILARSLATPVRTSSVAPLVQRQNLPIGTAQSIANGHAFDKHVQEQREFPEIRSVDDFATLIETIINSPAEHKALSNGRQAFWDGRNTVVIYNPNAHDRGTCFRPTAGKTYFDNLV